MAILSQTISKIGNFQKLDGFSEDMRARLLQVHCGSGNMFDYTRNK